MIAFNELKNCKICNHKPHEYSNYDGYGPFTIKCDNCGNSTRTFDYKVDKKTFEEEAEKACQAARKEWNDMNTVI